MLLSLNWRRFRRTRPSRASQLDWRPDTPRSLNPSASSSAPPEVLSLTSMAAHTSSSSPKTTSATHSISALSNGSSSRRASFLSLPIPRTNPPKHRHTIRVVRLPFSTLHLFASLTPTGTLLITHPSLSSPTPISVTYFRAGYTPTDYPTSLQWSTRLLLERSTSIKCPTLALQLAGCKKVQQVLAAPGQLDTFLHKGTTTSHLSPPPLAALDLTHAAQLLDSFTALYPLDSSPAGLSALSLALSQPERFVLKPQREGGGNNIYREDIPPFLSALETQDGEGLKGREGFILMDLIEPPEGVEAIMVKAGEERGVRSEVVSELGVYGVMLFRRGQDGGADVLVNETVGHLLRTKGERKR